MLVFCVDCIEEACGFILLLRVMSELTTFNNCLVNNEFKVMSLFYVFNYLHLLTTDCHA